MIHVSILVPSASAVQESVVSVFTILDQANDHALARGGDAIFDVHLVGTTDRVDLYGGQCSVTPDLRLAETCVHRSRHRPVAGRQYRRRAAPQCGVHPVDAGAVPRRRGSRRSVHRGVVRRRHGTGGRRALLAALVRRCGVPRKSFPTSVSSSTEPRRTSARSAYTGAYSFFHRVLERAGGREVASLCAASSEAAFNQQCQSVLTVADEVARASRHAAALERRSSRRAPRMTKGMFASMFEANRRGRRGSGGLDAVMPASPARANSSTLRRLIRRVPAQARLGRRSQ